MIKAKFKLILATALCGTFLVTPLLTDKVSAAEASDNNDIYKERFLELRGNISDPANGYYRDMGNGLKIPYHSRETFLCEGPDYGHETTSETYSYYLWLEAMYGKFSGDWTQFNSAWNSLEKYMIPSAEDQPNNDWYKDGITTTKDGKKGDPADFANEYLSTSKYPSACNNDYVGNDTLRQELKSTYETDDVYGMHWLLDTDDWYDYGKHGKDGESGYDKSNHDPVFINTYQRGPHESAFKTVTHPSWDDCKTYGGGNKVGFLGLFNGSDTHQWRYTIASDADARAIQATYWADKWAKENGDNTAIKADVSKATKLGDYLRYSMFDKYFRAIGCQNNAYAQGDNKHYLLGWYYSWGGDTDYEKSWSGSWAWRIGCSHNHFGYQNPMAAWVLSNDNSEDGTSDFTSKTATGKEDWANSLNRQVELYQWLQSDEGAIAGGCTNSYTTDNGSYQAYPQGSSTFYNMVYDEAPVYLDPPSNRWFGMQVWSLQRLAEYYYETGDARAQSVLNKWAKWAISNIKLTTDGKSYQIPSNLSWKGQPDTWTGEPTGNKNLHVTVDSYSGTDIGVTGSFANTLFYISKGNEKAGYDGEQITFNNQTGSIKDIAKAAGEKLLDCMWNNYKDEYGLGTPEEVNTKNYFDSEIYIPSNFTGKMGNGDVIKPGVKFIDIRSGYKNDPDYDRIKAAYDKGENATMTYHRYWGQVDAAIAYGTHAVLWNEPDTDPVLLGDANGDGKVTLADYTLLRRYISSGDDRIKINETNSDINKDGTVDFFDLIALKDLI